MGLFYKLFRKIHRLEEGTDIIFYRNLAHLFIYAAFGFGIILIAWLIYSKKYIYIGVIAGLIVLGEIAHYLRKSRESSIIDYYKKKAIEIKKEEIIEGKKALNKRLISLK